jgi:hypothetical protein
MSSKKKGEILEDLKKLFLEGKVTKTEILSVLEDSDIKRQKIDISQILYYMGAGVVALGVIILVSNFWDRFSDILRVTITLGVGFLYYAIGAFSFTSFYERRTITFLIFNIIFSLLFFFAFTAWLSDVGGFSSDGARLFLEYRFLFSGSILTLFGYYLSSGRYRTLTNFCYSVGLSSEYFSKSLGWPATLIILGFVLIGIGYMTIHLNNKVKKVQK